MLGMICLVVYLILAIGRVTPYDSEETSKAIAGGMIFLLCASYAITTPTSKTIATPITAFTIIALTILLVGSIPSQKPGYLFDKIQGGILAATAASFAISSCYLRYGIQRTHKAFGLVATVILILTIIYKLNAGFFDRGVRYLINGPIVFGWITGLVCIIQFQTYAKTKSPKYLLLGILFFISVLWTQSKGPLIALLLTFAYACTPIIFRNPYRSLLIIGTGVLIVFLNFKVIDSFLSETRFSVITRILSGQLQDSDEGSVGVRGELFDRAISQIEAHPVAGIGLGEFEHLGFKYPHNQHLEIATEIGLPAFFLHISFIAFCLFFSNRQFRSYVLFFFIAGLFSGDISYLRFLYTFALLGFIARKVEEKKPSNNLHQKLRSL
jgi:hypothetical protein